MHNGICGSNSRNRKGRREEGHVSATRSEPPPSRGPAVSASVAATLADAKGIDVDELSLPLYDAIDTDALNDLIATTDHTTHVSFAYHSYEITVRGDRHITIDQHSQ